jgi:hypothetical protein
MYFYNSKRLLSFNKKVEIKLGNHNIKHYGFFNIRKILKESQNCQYIKLQGKENEYFNCSIKRIFSLK